jgi:hypothetical protein
MLTEASSKLLNNPFPVRINIANTETIEGTSETHRSISPTRLCQVAAISSTQNERFLSSILRVSLRS